VNVASIFGIVASSAAMAANDAQQRPCRELQRSPLGQKVVLAGAWLPLSTLSSMCVLTLADEARGT